MTLYSIPYEVVPRWEKKDKYPKNGTFYALKVEVYEESSWSMVIKTVILYVTDNANQITQNLFQSPQITSYMVLDYVDKDWDYKYFVVNNDSNGEQIINERPVKDLQTLNRIKQTISMASDIQKISN